MSDERVAERQLRASTDGRTTVRGGGRGLATFAVLLALIAAGLAGFPYYQKVFGPSPEATLDTLRVSQEQRAADLRRALDEAVTGLDDRLKQQQARQSARLDEQDARIDANSAADATAVAASTNLANSLKLTEAEHLLQAANHAALLQRDGPGALAMLLAAQQLLEQVAEPAILGVRARLADEILALRSEPPVDVDATFLRLEKLKQNLPEPTSSFVATSIVAPADVVPGPLWQQALNKLLSLFEFRRDSSGARPILTVDEVVRLQLNLEVLLQTAQLALLRNDTAVYGQSLTAARTLLDEYRGNNDGRVASAQAEIDQLLALPLQHALPDLSGSLTQLRGVIAAAVAKNPPAPLEAATEAPAAAPVESKPAPEPGAAQ